MGARGRKSSAELQHIETYGSSAQTRLQPPPHLTQYEQKLFQDVVNNRPAAWFSLSDESILIQYVRHIAQSDTIASQISSITKKSLSTDDGLKRYEKLLKLQAAETREIANCATKMRLTQQATYNAKNASTLKESENSNDDKPWLE